MSHPTYTENLILLALHQGKEVALTASDAAEELKSIVRLSAAGVTEAAKRLASAGFIEETPRKKGQRTPRWLLRPAGKEMLASQLANSKMAGRGWKRNGARMLAAVQALGLEPGAAAAANGEGVLAYFLAKRLGEKFGVSTTLTGLARQVAAMELKLSRSDPDFIWEHLIKQALDAPATPLGAPGFESSAHGDSKDATALRNFVEEVKRAGRTAQEGWFGSQKLFIHHAWEAWTKSSGEGADLNEFKERLLRALRAGMIELSRADFPMGLEQSDLQTALTNYGDERFHFIAIEQEAPP